VQGCPATKLTSNGARFTEVGNSRAACPPVNGAAILILRHATSPFFHGRCEIHLPKNLKSPMKKKCLPKAVLKDYRRNTRHERH
jgi:hypothetical protein